MILKSFLLNVYKMKRKKVPETDGVAACFSLRPSWVCLLWQTSANTHKEIPSETLNYTTALFKITWEPLSADFQVDYGVQRLKEWKEKKIESVAYPSRLQQVPLALHAVLYVDQTQQIFLEGQDGRDGERLPSDGQKKER